MPESQFDAAVRRVLPLVQAHSLRDRLNAHVVGYRPDDQARAEKYVRAALDEPEAPDAR